MIRAGIQRVVPMLAVGILATAVAPSDATAQVPEHVQPNGTGGFDVYPTYVDDHANIQWAVAAAAPGSTVNLVGDHFYLSRTVFGMNFCGTLKGLGMESTVVHAMDEFAGPPPVMISFPYNRNLGYGWTGQGSLTVSDLKMVADGDYAWTWWNHGELSKEMAVGIFSGDFAVFETGYGSPTSVNMTFERLSFEAEPRTGEYYPWGASLLWPIDVEPFVGGEHIVRDIRMEGTSFIFFQGLYDGVLDISDVEATSLTNGGTSVVTAEMRKCSVSVTGVVTADASGVAVENSFQWYGTPLEPSTFFISHNDIDQAVDPWWAGIDIRDLQDVASTFVVRHNKIHSEGSAFWGPMLFNGTKEALVANNVITGHGPAAIYVGIEGPGHPEVDDKEMILRGNSFPGWETTAGTHPYPLELPPAAPIWLGPSTRECIVRGNPDDVLDEGHENVIAGN